MILKFSTRDTDICVETVSVQALMAERGKVMYSNLFDVFQKNFK